MSWFEVETKIKINKKELPLLREKIEKIAAFSKREIKKDSYFAIKKNNYPQKAFRIRLKGKDSVVNFKKLSKRYWKSGIVVKEEFEFKLINIENFLALMRDLGFEEWIKKTKISDSYLYKKDRRVVIEINKVENLGYFLEIEYLAEKHEIERAKRKIYLVLRELNIKSSYIDNTGYTKMLWGKSKHL